MHHLSAVFTNGCCRISLATKLQQSRGCLDRNCGPQVRTASPDHKIRVANSGATALFRGHCCSDHASDGN
eukprot:15442722-Alexandrium_andersonii.AAC.1